LDAVVADFYDGATVLLGDGEGGFKLGETYPTDPSGESVLICDVAADGSLDLVLDTGPPYGITILWGNGDGTFQQPRVYVIGEAGFPVASDLNHDGKLDFALVNGANLVTTALNTGVAIFSPSTPLEFPAQLVGTASSPQGVTLTNSGGTSLSIRSIAAAGDFRASNDCGGTLAAGASCTINVTFEPKKSGTLQGKVTLEDTASSKPQYVLVSGLSTPLALSPAELSFGSWKVGTTSPPQVVTVTNGSGSAIQFSNIDIAGADPKDFSIDEETCGVSLAAGASCTVTITFSPIKAGSRRGLNYVTVVGAPYPAPVTLVGVGK
jgi:hypothetical protein